MTERLYYTDSHLREFEARIVAVSPTIGGGSTVVLDRTAFYPTGGGQPTDTGTLGDARVIECIDAEADGVLHLIDGPVPEIGSVVSGRIDWERRLDHIQQHTGQHILSQAFIELFGAETKGFRMMEQVSELDVELDQPSDERINRAVDRANEVIWEDRSVLARSVTALEAAHLPLRKESAREGELRLIEIAGFDLTPCGGTHATRTGEVGMIATRHWERAKGMTRIEFVAGRRALSDYRRANQTAHDVASQFSVGRDEAPIAVARMFEENKALGRRVRALEEIAARVEADELIALAPQMENGTRLVTHIGEGRDAEGLKRLALAIIAHAKTVALLGSRDGDNARLVFARSDDAAGDMNALMREACALLDGRGGGRPELAQGGGRSIEKLESVVAQVKAKI